MNGLITILHSDLSQTGPFEGTVESCFGQDYRPLGFLSLLQGAFAARMT